MASVKRILRGTGHIITGVLRRPRTGGSKRLPGGHWWRPKAVTPQDHLRPGGQYPGDFHGIPEIRYQPVPGNKPDPGEVVWAWVPFEEDHTEGKDRPALVIGWDGSWLLAVPLTTKDHNQDANQEASQGRFWVDIGTGPWDSKRRDSQARLDRIVRLDPQKIRRVGGVLDEIVFRRVAQGVIEYLGR